MQPQRSLTSSALLLVFAPVTATAAFLAFPTNVAFWPAQETNDAGLRQAPPRVHIAPTPPPRLVYSKRQGNVDDSDGDNGDQTTFTVDVKVCGYENGLKDQAFQCVAETRSCTNDGTWIGCCEIGKTCVNDFPTACLDFQSHKANKCDNKGSRTVCCTDEEAPFCKVLTSDNSLTAVGCGSTEVFNGTLLSTPTDHLGPIVAITSPTKTTTIQPQTGFPGAGLETSQQANASSTPSSNLNTDKGTNVHRPSTGAIVAGVVGGVVVFALVIAGAVYFTHRKKEKDDHPPEPPPMVYCIPETAQLSPPRSNHGYAQQAGSYGRSSPHSQRSAPGSSNPSVGHTVRSGSFGSVENTSAGQKS